MLFLRSVNLRVERLCFLGITKIKWAEMSPDSISRTFLQHLLESSDTLRIKTHRSVCSLCCPERSRHRVGGEENGNYFRKGMFSIHSSSSTGHALTLTAGHGHMKELNDNLQGWKFGSSKAGIAAHVQGWDSCQQHNSRTWLWVLHNSGENHLQTETLMESWAKWSCDGI